MGSFIDVRAVLVVVAMLGEVLGCRGNATQVQGRTAASQTAVVDARTPEVRDDVAAKDGVMRWTGDAKAIEVRAMNGAIRAHAASTDRVEIVATRRGGGRRGESLRLRVLERAGTIMACVVAADDRDGEDDSERNSKRTDDEDEGDDAKSEASCSGGEMGVRGRIEIDVSVPKGVRFSGWTANGEVDVDGLDGEVEAHAQNGSVRIATLGVARASTVNGSVVARLGATRWAGTIELESVNGHVDVELASGTGLRLAAETMHGQIRVGLPMTDARVEDTRVEGTIGGGGGALRLRTVNGAIAVK